MAKDSKFWWCVLIVGTADDGSQEGDPPETLQDIEDHLKNAVKAFDLPAGILNEKFTIHVAEQTPWTRSAGSSPPSV